MINHFIVPLLVSLLTFFATTFFYQRPKEKRQDKIRLLTDLIRSFPNTEEEFWQAYRVSQIIFYDDKAVLKKWDHCAEIIKATRSSAESFGIKLAKENFLEPWLNLILAIAHNLEYCEITRETLKATLEATEMWQSAKKS